MAERFPALDALRGVAVMGILLMNIVAFAMPVAAYSNPLAYGARSPFDLWTWAVAFVLVDGKMRALFSFLFGASMLLVVDRATAAGRSGGATHAARVAVLFVIGAAHFVLLWWGDILMHYALVGLFAYAFVHAEPRTLVRLSIAAFLVTILLAAAGALSLWALETQVTLPGASARAVAAWAHVVDQIGVPSPAALRTELAEAHAPYRAMVAHRIADVVPRQVGTLIDVGVETLGLMLLGMWGLRSGFVTGDWPRARYLRTAAIAYAVGLPPLVALAAVQWRAGFDPLTVFAAANVAAAPFRPVVMFGHAALILSLVTPAPTRLAAVGRAAFSNYLGTTIVMTTLFYGYGFGLFGAVSRVQAYAIVPVVWMVMLAWSKPWLDRYRFGPAEWLWRSLARWERQPMHR